MAARVVSPLRSVILIGGGAFASSFFCASNAIAIQPTPYSAGVQTHNDIIWGGAFMLMGAMGTLYGSGDLHDLSVGLLTGGMAYLGLRLSNKVQIATQSTV